MPEYRDRASDFILIRSNWTGFFERLTELMILIMMSAITVFNTFYVPNHLKEYQIPIIFRGAETNVWFDRQRIHNTLFFANIIFSGCMPSLALMNIGSPCLHTGNPKFDLYWTDKYQFLISVLLWTVILPISFMLLSIALKDQSRLICYPILIANLIFGFIMIFMSFYLIM